MKIVCTQEEKVMIIDALKNAVVCLAPEEECNNQPTCSECIEGHIEWQIKDGERE